eukprot:COSAG06_NODE_32_length_31260_cov_54.706973_35_plen_59_part_00
MKENGTNSSVLGVYLFIYLLIDLFIAHAGGLKDAFDRAIGARAAHIRAEGTSNNIPDQ